VALREEHAIMWRFVPLSGVVLLIAITLCLRPFLQFCRHGTSGIFLFRSGNAAQTVRDCLLVLFFGVLLGQAIVATRPGSLDLLVAEHSPLHQTLQIAGAILMLGGIAFLALAQLHLGASWRIGIDAEAKPGLVTDGLYRYSRNPIYLGLLTTLVGYCALLPTVLSVILLVATTIGMRAQIAGEEAYLIATYGEAFRDYARRVGRLVPGLGKL
jgi:protein-S-isoprenylcysteine O-methyltransferase Ste14